MLHLDCPPRCPAMLHPLTTAYAAGYGFLPPLAAPHASAARTMGEAALQAGVLELAVGCGWRVHHETDSRRSWAGLPDLILVRPPRLMVLELKAARGRLAPAQRAWLADLAGAGVEVAVAGPGDLLVLADALSRRSRAPRLPAFDPGPGRVPSWAEVAAATRSRSRSAKRPARPAGELAH